MPTQPRLYPRQPPFFMCCAHTSRSRQRLDLPIDMIRHIKHVLGRPLKPLLAIPRHVLNHHERAVADQDVIQVCVLDDGTLVALDDAGEDGEAGGKRGVGGQDVGGAFLPLLDRGVDDFLDVGAVEVATKRGVSLSMGLEGIGGGGGGGRGGGRRTY